MNNEEYGLDDELAIQDDDLVVDAIPDVRQCRIMIREFKKQNYFPEVYHVNERGNTDLLAIGWNGAKIIKSWV